jgi:hypothetical protein
MWHGDYDALPQPGNEAGGVATVTIQNISTTMPNRTIGFLIP